MIRADLHVHTVASSDCEVGVEDVLVNAKKQGMDCIAITDHDTVISVEKAKKLSAKYGIQIIPGVEITCKEGTHILGYFLSSCPKERELSVLETISYIHQHGGIACIAHPYRSGSGIMYNHHVSKNISTNALQQAFQSSDLIEAINFKSTLRKDPDGFALATTYKKPVLASTDAHHHLEVGRSYTTFHIPEGTPLTKLEMVYAKRTLATLAIPPNFSLPTDTGIVTIEPSTQKVSTLKKVIPPALVSYIGKIFYKLQAVARYRNRQRILEALFSNSPEYSEIQ